jgi:RNA polymerase sigma factor (sigma-70 family)
MAVGCDLLYQKNESETLVAALSVEESSVTDSPWQRILDIVRRRADPDAAGPLADERLLARFVANGDPSAFELLVWRHGSLVFGTCRRILNDVHAAEDAFQATFLALARKPRAVRSGAALAGWLHRIALRISNKVRVSRALQSRAELAAAQDCAVSPADIEQHETAVVVDEEIDRLPERLRRAVVLCYLDGRTTEQAAAILACPRGTVLSRLHTARERLRDRLTRRGLTLPVAGISALLFASDSPATLVPLAVRAALTGASPVLTGLVQGVFHAMFMTKVKLATALTLGIGFAAAGIGWVVVPGSGPAVVQADEPKPEAPSTKAVTTNSQNQQVEPEKTLQTLLDEQNKLLEQLEKAEQEHQDFRQRSPIVLFTGSNAKPLAWVRMESVNAKRTELQLKSIELDTRLRRIRSLLDKQQDQASRDEIARTELVKLQARGVDMVGMRKLLTTDGKEPSSSELISRYALATESEIEEMRTTIHTLDGWYDQEQKALRELSYSELQDDRLRNKIIQTRKMYDEITKQVADMKLQKNEKPK